MCCARAWHTDEHYECFDLACIDAIPMITATSTYATLLRGGETKASAIASADPTGRLAFLNGMTLRVREVMPFLRRYVCRFTYA